MKDCHTRARHWLGRAVVVAVTEAVGMVVVDWTLVRIFLPNGYAFCLE
jgi:hypothetical protein